MDGYCKCMQSSPRIIINALVFHGGPWGFQQCSATFVLEVEASVADGAVAAEGQVHGVGATLDALGQLAVLEGADQRAAAVWPIVDVQEVVVGFDAETDGGRGV